MVFGGGVLATICSAMSKHYLFHEHFTSLLDDTVTYHDDTIQEGLEFFVTVFSNLRLKDLCRKYNSRLSKTNTVGIRQSLAANRKVGKRDIKRREKEREPEAEEEIPEEELHFELESIAERGLDDEIDMVEEKEDDCDSSNTNSDNE
jgi:hypothetical protein